MCGDTVIILHASNHTVIESDFPLFAIYFARVNDSLCLFFKLLPFVLEIFICDMRYNHEFVAFSVNFHFESEKIRVMISYIDNPRFLFRNFQFEPFFQPQSDCTFGAFSGVLCPTKDSKIICIANNEHFLQVRFFSLSKAVFRSSIPFANRTPLPLTFYPVV